jgi:hypothetical protein
MFDKIEKLNKVNTIANKSLSETYAVMSFNHMIKNFFNA